MKIVRTEIDGLGLIAPTVFRDHRGYFLETFHQEKFASQLKITDQFVQDNQSLSSRGVLRGLHYQVRRPQAKLIRVLQGEIFDVAVDLRRSSASFGKWLGFNLTAESFQQLYIPAGFAHGFIALSESAEILYKTSDTHFPEFDRSIAWNDPDLKITWPLERVGGNPILSPKDAAAGPFRSAETFS